MDKRRAANRSVEIALVVVAGVASFVIWLSQTSLPDQVHELLATHPGLARMLVIAGGVGGVVLALALIVLFVILVFHRT